MRDMKSLSTPSAIHITTLHDAASGWLLVWSVLTAFTTLLVGSIIFAPLIRSGGGDSMSAQIIYQTFGHFCHQIPERSFHVAGEPFAVCARCFGIYAGFLAGVACFPWWRRAAQKYFPSRWWLLAALLPMCLDVALEFFGMWKNTHTSRVITGAILGVVAAVYVVPGLIDARETLADAWRAFRRSRTSNSMRTS